MRKNIQRKAMKNVGVVDVVAMKNAPVLRYLILFV